MITVNVAYVPTKTTLKKYGLSQADYLKLLKCQGYKCPICEKYLDTRVCIDHEHVKGFKSMPDDKKKLYVRGLVHWFCNHYYLGRSITVQKARNVVTYLEEFEKRKPK